MEPLAVATLAYQLHNFFIKMKIKFKKIIFPVFVLFFALTLSPALAQTGTATWEYPNPLKVSSFTQWLGNLLASIQGIVGWLAVIMIFIGGIVYITSAGSQNQITWAKNIIKWALIGFAIAVAAPALLKEIKDLVSNEQASAADLIDNANTMRKILVNVLNFLLAGIGILSLIGLTVGGATYLTSAGDRGRIDTAKKMILYSMIAIAVSGSGIILLKQILTLLAAQQ